MSGLGGVWMGCVRGLACAWHMCEQGTPGMLPGERWEGFCRGEEVGGQPHAFCGDSEV